MNEEEKKDIELDIEAKYVGKTEKEFLSRVTYEECIYILRPENYYCDKIIKLSLLKLQKENELAKQALIKNCNIADERNQLLEENEKLKNKLLDTLEGQKVIEEETPQYIKENYIPKQKVKDKIEKILNNKEYRIVFEGNAEFPDDATIINAQKYIKLEKMQELIEESEEK